MQALAAFALVWWVERLAACWVGCLRMSLRVFVAYLLVRHCDRFSVTEQKSLQLCEELQAMSFEAWTAPCLSAWLVAFLLEQQELKQ
ncbi:Uncharacterised protein [Chlamydia trachomatis]|nr:Uncharacterised protein [Chlamydia trachomatis]